jgi:hypothetical protein
VGLSVDMVNSSSRSLVCAAVFTDSAWSAQVVAELVVYMDVGSNIQNTREAPRTSCPAKKKVGISTMKT